MANVRSPGEARSLRMRYRIGLEWNSAQTGANVLGSALDAMESQGYILFFAHQDTLAGGGATTLESFQALQEPYGAR
jgi:hypothetical protein